MFLLWFEDLSTISLGLLEGSITYEIRHDRGELDCSTIFVACVLCYVVCDMHCAMWYGNWYVVCGMPCSMHCGMWYDMWYVVSYVWYVTCGMW